MRQLSRGAMIGIAVTIATLGGILIAYSYPGNVFLTATPAEAPAAEDKRVSEEASHEVDETGAAHYRIPITVPPGRQGMQPKLALTYSSRNPVRGGIAAGWTLSIPRIELDTSEGLLAGTFYRSTISGTRLVPVPEATTTDAEAFRSEFDTTYVRYERVKDMNDPNRRTLMWRMRTTDGRTWFFGDRPLANEAADAMVIGRSFLSRVVDKFGNSMEYSYATASGNGPVRQSFIIEGRADTYLTMIEWGKNDNAGLPHHARARFEYALDRQDATPPMGFCPGSNVPIGASFTYRLGYPLYEGAKRLIRIRLEVSEGSNIWREVRRYDLNYDQAELACPTGRAHAPLRLLTLVREVAVDPIYKTEISIPYVFEYGRRELEWKRSPAQFTAGLGSGENQQSNAKAGSWPTLISMPLDLNGDGRLDGITVMPDGSSTNCLANSVYGQLRLPIVPWANGGPGQFGTRNNNPPPSNPPPSASLDYTYTREGCSASHQFSRVVGRISDINGVKVPEGWVPATEQVPYWPATYMSYRFLDVTGDGRPDLVTAIDSNRGMYRPDNDSRLAPQQPSLLSGSSITTRAIAMPRLPGSAEDLLDPANWKGSCADCPPKPPSKEPEQASYDWAKDDYLRKSWIKPEPGPNLSYVFRVYENTGNGFATQPRVIYSPVPLETDRATSSLGAGPQALGSMYHGFLDIDGDGLIDALSNGGNYLTQEGILAGKFNVYRGDGTGNFLPLNPLRPWSAPVVSSLLKVKLQVTGGGGDWGKFLTGNEGHTNGSGPQVLMQDLNGDGLPDYINSESGRVRVFYNTGQGFVSPFAPPGYTGETVENAVAGDPVSPPYNWKDEPALKSYHLFELNSTLSLQLLDALNSPSSLPLKQVWSRTVMKVVDIDVDGLPDLIHIQAPAWFQTDPLALNPNKAVVRLFINVGDKLIPMGEPATLATRTSQGQLAPPALWQALSRITIGGSDGPWRVWTDFVDLDGDGLPEAIIVENAGQSCTPDPTNGLIDFACFGNRYAYSSPKDDPKDQQGLRLLRTVRNDRGGTVQFHYQPWDANLGGRVPYPLWLVSRVTVNAGPDAHGQPSLNQVTSYTYKQAMYNKDHRGDWGFRGFGTVEKISPNPDPSKAGSLTVTTYDYSLHYGGLPVAVRVYDAPGGRPHRVTKTVWGRYTLFANMKQPLVTFHKREVETRTCGAAQSPADCEANGAARFDITEWAPVMPPGGSVPILFFKVRKWESEQRNIQSPAPGTKWREFTPQLISNLTAYRLITVRERRSVMGADRMIVGGTTHVYDPGLLVELRTEEQIDPQNAGITARTYDMTTGNVLTVTHPNHVGTPLATRFSYDVRKLFVSQTINELGHAVDATYNLATGVQVSSRGPNIKNGVKEGWERKLDAFGRVLEERVYLDHATQGYAAVVMTENRYVDRPFTPAQLPLLNGHAGIVTQKRIDQDRWTTSATEVDGLGRVVGTTMATGAGAPLAVSRFYYDAAGNLAKADLPSPTQAPGPATVTYVLHYDTHGRRTLAFRPDQTGQRWIYDGRWTTREDLIANKGGMVSRTRTLTDAWDRIARTEEQVTETAWAATRYEYDGNDNVRRITNADGIGTDMVHDWLSRRVSVTKGGQRWSYGYDLNGNMTSIVAPVPMGADPKRYTTTIMYDALDRPLSRFANRRDLADAQFAVYGSATTKYAYDTGMNGIGRLATITQAQGRTTTFTYDARGLVVSEQRTFSILGDTVKDNRTTFRTYNALGSVSTLTFADGPTPQESTTISYTYDDRGLATQVKWQNQNAVLGHAAFTSAGGLATRGGPLAGTTTHQMTYLYDDLGRVLRLHLTTSATGQPQATLLDHRYAYTGSDDVASMNVTLGVIPQPVLVGWNFAYDKQHQLIRSAGPMNYLATFTYSPGGRVLSADVNAAPEAARVHRRKVRYDYAQGDPEAPDRLFDPATGATWMTMTYDPAGNVIQRNVQGQTWTHLYDGADLQREVRAPNNTSELYWYDHERQRTLIVSKSATGTVELVRWVLGNTEIWYDGTGRIIKTLASVPFNGTYARIEDRTKARLLYSNPRGDILFALDQSQPAPAAEFAYGPYGDSIKEGGTDLANVLERFNGKQLDVTSGLHYYGYRYFDERSLTWTQADPLYRFAPDIAKESPRRFATYAFSLNNPLRYVDPNGLAIEGGGGVKPRDPFDPDNPVNTPDPYVGSDWDREQCRKFGGHWCFMKWYEKGDAGSPSGGEGGSSGDGGCTDSTSTGCPRQEPWRSLQDTHDIDRQNRSIDKIAPPPDTSCGEIASFECIVTAADALGTGLKISKDYGVPAAGAVLFPFLPALALKGAAAGYVEHKVQVFVDTVILGRPYDPIKDGKDTIKAVLGGAGSRGISGGISSVENPVSRAALQAIEKLDEANERYGWVRGR